MANIRHPNQPSEEELTNFLSKVDELDEVLKGLNSKEEDEQITYTKKADQLIEKLEKEKNNKGKEKKDEDDGDDADLPKTTIGFSRTSINKDAFKNESPADNGPNLPAGTEPMDQKAFMAAMEADAQERYERKKAAEKVATALKEKGNAAFKLGNYQEALEYYDKAISEQRDSSVLYTNRAQAKIKLGMFTEALTDCDWALRAWPNCLKAYVHQGHAHLALKQWEEARESYSTVEKMDKSKAGVVKHYLSEVSRREQATMEEEKALRLFEEGHQAAQGVVDLLSRVHKQNQLPPYYAGGFRVIASLLTDVDSQTLFRTNDGLMIPDNHPLLRRCLTSSTASLSREEKDVLSAGLDMLTAACKNNETSQQQLLAVPEFPSRLLTLLESNVKGQGKQLKTSCLNLLYEISLTEAGRAALVGVVDLGRFITTLFPLMTKKSALYGNTAAALLNNIALEKRSKSLLRENIEETILPAFENLLRSNQTSRDIVGVACSTATNLAADARIRTKMAARDELWDALTELVITLTESALLVPLSAVLGLLQNISTGVEPKLLANAKNNLASALCTVLDKYPPQSLPSLKETSQSSSEQTTSSSSPPSNTTPDSNSERETTPNAASATDMGDNSEGRSPEWDVTVRSLVVLSNVLPASQSCAQFMSAEQQATKLIDAVGLPQSEVYKPGLKSLTALTQSSHAVRALLVRQKGLSTLLTHLTSSDEAVSGNAALCLSHLARDEQGVTAGGNLQTIGSRVCSRLTKTNVVQTLLVLCRDGRKSDLQANCAILLGRLAQGDVRHLERLRELHGIQILHECMKHVKT